MLKGFIGTDEVAKQLGYADSSTIRHFIRESKIVNCAKISGVWLVAETEVKRMLDLGYGKNNNNNTPVQSTVEKQDN